MCARAVALSEWPRDGLERVRSCPVCGSASRAPLHLGLTDRSYLCAPGTWDLFRCSGCSSAYLDPRPTAETVGQAYASYYEGMTANAEQPPFGWSRRLRRAIRNGYLASRYGYRMRPASRAGRFLVPLAPRHREEADEFVRHLRLERGRARLLDVGCGDGEFLARMEHLGWDVEGIDPSEDAVRLARSRGVSVQLGTLDPATDLPTSTFDAVTFRLVLEHLHDPAAGLAAARELLKPGGVVWIATPSLEAEAHRRFGPDWIFLETPRHAVMFTPSSLARLLRRVGFEPTDLRPSRQARWSFRLSAAIAEGLPPFRQAPALPPRLAFQAGIADLKALVRPTLADVVVLVARKA